MHFPECNSNVAQSCSLQDCIENMCHVQPSILFGQPIPYLSLAVFLFGTNDGRRVQIQKMKYKLGELVVLHFVFKWQMSKQSIFIGFWFGRKNTANIECNKHHYSANQKRLEQTFQSSHVCIFLEFFCPVSSPTLLPCPQTLVSSSSTCQMRSARRYWKDPTINLYLKTTNACWKRFSFPKKLRKRGTLQSWMLEPIKVSSAVW